MAERINFQSLSSAQFSSSIKKIALPQACANSPCSSLDSEPADRFSTGIQSVALEQARAAFHKEVEQLSHKDPLVHPVANNLYADPVRPHGKRKGSLLGLCF